MSYLNYVQETKVFLALAAWRSYERLQRETDFWETLVEQRIANFSEAELEEFYKKRTGPVPAAAKPGLDPMFPRALAPHQQPGIPTAITDISRPQSFVGPPTPPAVRQT